MSKREATFYAASDPSSIIAENVSQCDRKLVFLRCVLFVVGSGLARHIREWHKQDLGRAVCCDA